MAGNVWEWCLNQYDDPSQWGLENGASCALRGGAWDDILDGCRAAYRNGYPPDGRINFIGFRVCRGSPIDPRDAAPLGAETPSR